MRAAYLLIVAMALVLTLAACQRQAQAPEIPAAETTAVTQTGDMAVDSVGNQITAADSDSEDLDPNSMGDIDSGLADVENI